MVVPQGTCRIASLNCSGLQSDRAMPGARTWRVSSYRTHITRHLCPASAVDNEEHEPGMRQPFVRIARTHHARAPFSTSAPHRSTFSPIRRRQRQLQTICVRLRSGVAEKNFRRWNRSAARSYRLTTDRNTLGSKYCDAGTGFSILATRTKKSVTCCSHSVMVPLL